MKTLITLIAAACLVGPAFAQQPNQPQKPGPEYKAYDVWVGDWQYEGETMASPLAPAGKFSGKQTARWILNGFFLEFRWEEKGPLGDVGAVELDWYDAATKSYPYQGFQNNGDMYSATGTVSGNAWKSSGNVTHQGIKYQTRGVSTFAADGMSFTWESEVSADGKTWQVFAKGKATKVAPAPADTASVEKELIKLEDGWAAALLKADVAYLDQILMDDYTDTDAKGTVTNKAQHLANLKSGDLKFAVFVPDDYRVHVYGDTAVVTGRNTLQAQFKGADISGQYRWTDTWVKRDGRWLCVATHLSKVAAAPAAAASVEQELIKLEEDWAKALVARDIQTLDRIEADDWIYTDPDGTASTKAQDMGDLKSGAYVATSFVVDDMKARVYGETAVVTGRTTETSTYKGKDTSGQYRWTDTWVKQAGRWQCVATHVSKISQK